MCVCVCSVNLKVTEKSFNFARKYKLPLYFVSASDGTNVVKVNSIAVITIVTVRCGSVWVSVLMMVSVAVGIACPH